MSNADHKAASATARGKFKNASLRNLAAAYLELRELAKELLEDCDNSCWPSELHPIRKALEE